MAEPRDLSALFRADVLSISPYLPGKPVEEVEGTPRLTPDLPTQPVTVIHEKDACRE